ncbi:MAG: hypothetical protein U0414_34695 [Polyangiaceae bacterium]
MVNWASARTVIASFAYAFSEIFFASSAASAYLPTRNQHSASRRRPWSSFGPAAVSAAIASW